MENEAASSMKIAVSLMIISLLILCIIITVNIVKPTVYEKTISIVNIADEEYEKKYEEFDQAAVSGTKVVRLLRECESLGLGIIYQTYNVKKYEGYAVNIGTVFEGAAYSPYQVNGHSYDRWKIMNLSSWKAERKNEMFYTSYFLKKDDDLVKCTSYVNSVFTETNNEYVTLDGRFYSELIKDSTGEVIGIIFTQQ